MIYTEQFLKTLRTCEKKITTAPGEFKEDRGHRKQDFEMMSLDEEHHFIGFTRQNIHFIENFSVGLLYNPRSERGKITLLRYNGPHGENVEIEHHETFHIHYATADRINAGKKAEGHVVPTDRYASFEDAIQVFLKTINLREEDKKQYFPPPNGQGFLFDDEHS